MSVTIQKSPATVVPVKNQVLFKLHTDNRITTPGVNAIYSLSFSDGDPEVNMAFTLEFGTESLTFTCKQIPDDSGLQFGRGFASASLFAAHMVTVFESNYIFTKYFSILIRIDYTVFIIAKNTGVDYNITLSNNTLAGLSGAQNTPGVDEVNRDFFRIFSQIFVNGSLIDEIAVEPDNDDNITIDLSEYIRPQLQPSFTWPLEGNIMRKLTGVSKSFYIKYSEQFGTPPVVQKLNTSSTYYAIPGGISINKFKKYELCASSWWANIQSKRLFLTNQPKGKYVRAGQPEMLYFINYTADTTLTLKLKVYFSDGTTAVSDAYTLGGLTQYDILEIFTGYTPLQLDLIEAAAGKTITQYKVWLVNDGGDLLSEKFNYYIETKPFLFDRYFIFKNSLGFYETFRSTGIGSKEINIEKTLVKQPLPLTYTKTTRGKTDVNKKVDAVFTVNSGFAADQVTVDWLANEFLLSDDVYLVLEGILYPVVINNDNSGIYHDDNYQYFIEVELEMSFTDHSYSIPPELAALIEDGGSFNRDFNNDLDIVEL